MAADSSTASDRLAALTPLLQIDTGDSEVRLKDVALLLLVGGGARLCSHREWVELLSGQNTPHQHRKANPADTIVKALRDALDPHHRVELHQALSIDARKSTCRRASPARYTPATSPPRPERPLSASPRTALHGLWWHTLFFTVEPNLTEAKKRALYGGHWYDCDRQVKLDWMLQHVQRTLNRQTLLRIRAENAALGFASDGLAARFTDDRGQDYRRLFRQERAAYLNKQRPHKRRKRKRR